MKKLIRNVFYFFLDTITFGRGVSVTISDFKFIFPWKFYKFFPLDYEKENFIFFRNHCKPHMNIIDIGAHFGLFSVFMSKLLGGKVFSFEPTPSTTKILKKFIKLNKVENSVEVIQAAASDSSGKSIFYINPEEGAVGNSLVKAGEINQIAKGYEVDVIRLDDFVDTKKIKIDFIKIDAEGAELHVLKGAEKILKKDRPFIMLGIHPNALKGINITNEMIWDFLASHNYQVWYNGQKILKDHFCNEQHLFDVQLIPANTH